MYKRRIVIFMLIILLGLLGLAARLYQLQIASGSQWHEQYNQGARPTALPALRGQILDRQGRILAMDQPCFDLRLDYRFITAQPAWVRKQQRLLEQSGLSSDQAKTLYEQRARHTWQLASELAGSREQVDSKVRRIVWRVSTMREHLLEAGVVPPIAEEVQCHTVVDGLNEEQTRTAKLALDDTVGMAVEPSRRRWYPANDIACHVVGRVGQVKQEDQDRYNAPQGATWLEQLNDYEDGDLIGQGGVEGMCEQELRGQRGYMRYLDRERRQKPEVRSPQAGSDIKLSLDAELQRRITERFPQGYNGSVVVIDVPTGEVLAMVSLPTYDLNTFSSRASQLNNDYRDFPLRNRAIARLYEPGSTIKPLIALGALTEGVITAATTFTCEKYYFSNIQNYLTCTGIHGPVNVVAALQHSCNIFFYHVGERMEKQQPGSLVAWLTRFGWKDRPGTGLPEERAGNLSAQATPEGGRMVGIGQTINVSPLHVANAMAAIARDGVYLSPTLLLDDKRQRERRDLGVRAQDLAAVWRGMWEVANIPGATAYNAFHQGERLPIEICGKTGSAQTPDQWKDLNGNGRRDEDETIRSGVMAWFAGFAPANNPRIAFAVVLEYVDYDTAGGGGKVSAPLAKELIRDCIELGYIRP